MRIYRLNPFQANVPYLYPLKTSGNLWFSDVFRGYRKGTLAWNGLNRSKEDEPLLQVKMILSNRGFLSTKRKHQQQESLYKKICQLAKEKETLSRRAKRLQKRIKRGKKSTLKLPETPNANVHQELEVLIPSQCKKLPKNFCMLKFCKKQLYSLKKEMYL